MIPRDRSVWSRTSRYSRAIAVIGGVLWGIGALVHAAGEQGADSFRGRLSAVPIDFVTAPTTRGVGAFTARLEGDTLTIAGTFERMNSPATVAHVHRAPKGLRGPGVFTLTVTADTNGLIEGTLSLTAAEIDVLRDDRFYVQIHSEANPGGHLRGWILDADQGDRNE
jgi:hypothetical protein